MSGDLSDEVEQYIREREPLDQGKIEAEFGRRGIKELRRLMINNRVSYNLGWKLQTETDAPEGDKE